MEVVVCVTDCSLLARVDFVLPHLTTMSLKRALFSNLLGGGVCQPWSLFVFLFVVQEANDYNAGVYHCLASNDAGWNRSMPFKLRVCEFRLSPPLE